MEMVVLSIHLLVCVSLIGLVLLQRSEGGALGMGGGGSGSLMSGRGAADALARMTSVAGGFFLVTSLSLTVISGAQASNSGRSIFDLNPALERLAPTPTPAPVEPSRTDPTESSAPQAAETQLASLAPAPTPAAGAPEVAPPPVQAAERAGPLTPLPASTRTTRAPQPAVQQPAAAAPRRSPPVQAQPQPAAVTGPPPAATAASTGTAAPRTTPIQTNPVRRPPSTATPASTRPAPAARPALVLPNTSGAGTSPLEAEQTPPESVNAGAGLEAVRRERAGPDQ